MLFSANTCAYPSRLEGFASGRIRNPIQQVICLFALFFLLEYGANTPDLWFGGLRRRSGRVNFPSFRRSSSIIDSVKGAFSRLGHSAQSERTIGRECAWSRGRRNGTVLQEKQSSKTMVKWSRLSVQGSTAVPGRLGEVEGWEQPRSRPPITSLTSLQVHTVTTHSHSP